MGASGSAAPPDLLQAIRAALARPGDEGAPWPPPGLAADLAPIDEFHVRGREATAELAAALDLSADTRVLDIGSGLGGASRYLATTAGCRVTGVDLTSEYCRAAAGIAQWLGLEQWVRYAVADALHLPFAAAGFDVAWTQHVAMAVADKPALYRELRRVLRPGGRLAFYDVLAGSGEPLLLPVPWAGAAADSHLATPAALQALLATAGFEMLSWEDRTAAGLEWFARMGGRRGGVPALSLRLLLGAAAPAMVQNLRRNLEEGRAILVSAICRAVQPL